MYDIGAFSHIGKRKYQQDTTFTPPWGSDATIGILVALCDGMGGLENSQHASQVSADYLAKRFYEDNPSDVHAFFTQCISEVDRNIYENMLGGTTLVSAIVRGSSAYFASVGDSRIYLVRGDKMTQLTTDHNYLRELETEAQGDVKLLEYAYSHPRKDALTSYIGMGGLRYLDISPETALHKDDILLLCSDGLYRTLSAEEILKLLNEYSYAMQTAAQNLIAYALEKQKQTQDNLSVILIHVA